MLSSKTNQRKIIWTSQPDFEDWEDDLKSEYPEYDEDELIQIMYDINAEYLEDEKLNLIYTAPTLETILVIGSLGLWNGRKDGYKVIESGRLEDCLAPLCSPAGELCWYIDGEGNLRCEEIHHDGRNYYLYREFKPEVTEEQREELLDKIYFSTFTNADIEAVTKPLGKYFFY